MDLTDQQWTIVEPLFGKWSADGRIRTGDPLFTNQAAIEFSLRIWLSIYT
jgi:hypothetical protein